MNKIEMMRKVVTELRQAGRKLIPVEIGLRQVEIGLRQVEIEVVSEQTTIEKGSARVEMELKRVQSRPTQEMSLLRPQIHLDDCPQEEEHSEEKNSMEWL